MHQAVYLLPSRQGNLRRGHPWVFPKAIQRQASHLKNGELVEVYNTEGERLGVGVYNEHSLYRVRLLAYTFENIDTSSIQSIVTYRLQQAIKLRQHLCLPNEKTNAYRLFNSEGDGLSGLTIDCFNDYCAVSSSAYWVEMHRESIIQIIQALMSLKVVWLPQAKPLSQDGWQQTIERQAEGNPQVLEAGVYFQIDFKNTQKTGLFLDQRENHQRIAALASGKRVLDLYTYTGGFALHAAMQGAAAVTAVDSSAQAIALAKQNAHLNHIDTIEFIEADARDYLVRAKEYDLIILDPPKLAPSKRHAEQAKNYYRFLHRELFKHMNPGALLMTCNCSSALNNAEFCELVSLQALAVGKTARILGVYGPASCHPTLAAFPEGHYLTAVLLAIN